jgi:hypothetical protein
MVASRLISPAHPHLHGHSDDAVFPSDDAVFPFDDAVFAFDDAVWAC